MTTSTNPPTYVREDTLVHSRKPIALDLGSWTLREEPTTWGRADEPEKQQHGSIWHARINVIAVRGSAAKPKVAIGRIGDTYVVADWHTDVVPQTPAEFMATWDNRYGVHSVGTWDGRNLWCESRSPTLMAEIHDRLEKVFDRLPAVPDGYNGWWLQPRKGK